ncbi:MAG: hypothetical protein J5598_03060 [Clostridia bacterium]|nr:hypothetical protein [Clostridia bacterium]
MANESLLLNFVVPTTIKEAAPSADLSWLKNVIVIAQPKSGSSASGIVDYTSVAAIKTDTDSKCFELMEMGMKKISICYGATLADAKALLDADTTHRYMTVLIDPVFTDISAALAWTRDYVLGWQSSTKADAKAAAAAKDVCAFNDATDTTGILMYRAFGQFLSQNSWKDLQLTRLDDSDTYGITDMGVANELFDAGVSFAITDPEYKTCLALFAAGGKTITAPYISRQAKIQTQSLFVQYLSLRNPKWTKREAGMIESYLNNQVDQIFVQTGLVNQLRLVVDLDTTEGDWYVAGVLEIEKPKAIWRMKLDFYQDIIEGV